MRPPIALVLLAILSSGGAATAAPPAPETVRFVKVATGFRFTEGPAWDGKGALYFTDVPNQRIHALALSTGTVRVVREDSGRANGLAFDPKGRLVACEGGGRRVVRIEGKTVTALAERHEGKRLNSPNDLAIDARGGIWFTDPRYGRGADRELDYEGVFYLPPGGATVRTCPELEKPNGILLGADGKTLYVADNKRKLLMAYDVPAPGKAEAGRVFARMDAQARGGPDGMTRDAEGNVYAAGQGAIWVWNAAGKPLARYACPEGPSNCTFGGPGGTTLYVTARTSVYRLARNAEGGPR